MDPKCVAALLSDYSRLKQDSCDCFESDTYYLMQALEQITDTALREYPIYAAVLEAKIDGLKNADIRELLHSQFDVWYTPEYITALWTKKIPNLIAETAKRDFVIWQTRSRKLPTKKCGKCGRVLPKADLFFSPNSGSKDGYYSICKDCRSTKSRRKCGKWPLRRGKGRPSWRFNPSPAAPSLFLLFLIGFPSQS